MGVLWSLGNLLGTIGEVNAAISLLHRELDLAAQIGGEDDSGTLQSLENLADLLEDHGRITEAEPLRRRHIALLEGTLGMDNEETLRIKQNFGDSLHQANRPFDALPLIRDVAERRMRLSGEESLETAAYIPRHPSRSRP
jgi:hypothetical protein